MHLHDQWHNYILCPDQRQTFRLGCVHQMHNFFCSTIEVQYLCLPSKELSSHTFGASTEFFRSCSSYWSQITFKNFPAVLPSHFLEEVYTSSRYSLYTLDLESLESRSSVLIGVEVTNGLLSQIVMFRKADKEFLLLIWSHDSVVDGKVSGHLGLGICFRTKIEYII